MKAIIDTNVLLVANGQHAEASPKCVEQCVDRLLAIQASSVNVIDAGYEILGEYQNKTSLYPPKGVGDVFPEVPAAQRGQSCLCRAGTDYCDRKE